MLVTRCAQARPVPKTQTNSRLARRARFDRHRLVASPSSGACRRRCRRFGFPVRAGKTPSSNGMPRSRAETWIQARAAHGPERASRLRRGSPGLDSGPLGRPLFRRCTALSATRSPVPSIYSSASPMGRKSALRREIPWILRGFRSRASKLLICGPFQKGRVLAQDGCSFRAGIEFVGRHYEDL